MQMIKLSCQSLVLTVALCAFSPALSAQPTDKQSSPKNQDPTILVTGTRETSAEEKQIVRQILSQPFDVYSRFYTGICPLIVGMPADAAERVTLSIRSTSRDIGLPEAKDKCLVNLIIAVTPPGDGPAFIKMIAKKRKKYLDLGRVEKANVLKSQGPIWNWHLTEIKAAGGIQVRQISSISVGGVERFVGPGAYALDRLPNSRIAISMRWDTATAFIVFDGNKAKSLGTDRLASLSTMLALAKIDILKIKEVQTPTILNAIFTDTSIERMSSFDVNLLRGLYTGKSERSKSRVVQTISSRLEKFDCSVNSDFTSICEVPEAVRP